MMNAGYDRNGNILGLKRSGKNSSSAYGMIDNLTLTYDGNQLKNVTDAATDPLYNGVFNFTDENKGSGTEYLYDSNGNMQQDYNKKISKIQYNLLNLPATLQFTNGNRKDYTYSADGKKLKVVHRTAIANISVPMGQIKELAANQISQTHTVDYCGNVIYENGSLSKVLTEEGYATLSGTTPTFYYYLKDHQGNNRMVVRLNGTSWNTEQVNHYYPFGGVFEVNTGTSGKQSYKYNGKELDRMHGLDWYDYEARHYDAALGRFTIVDPLGEKYYSWSPYTYCKNNPINRIDPDGKDDYLLEPRGRLHNRTPKSQRGKNSVDKLYSYSGNSRKPMGKNIEVKPGLLSQMLEIQKEEEGYGTYGSTQNVEDAAQVFKFAADNSKAEWKLDVYNNNGTLTAVVATNQKEDNVQNGDYAQKRLSVSGVKIVNIHSHPNPNGTKGGSEQDMMNAKPNPTKNAVYFKANQTLYEYDRMQSKIRATPVQSGIDILKQVGIR
ncbi:JAB-like toxin 1 domain-containing protein [uncultured Bacteroides sp.]|uniref:JAB-like toxin 1 domain-containing protein n=1 Tax=uncultured Bacteroides sp. TaxID=162156 RepID=UPI0025E86A65|nr:JAB-like toxin 1 domain-containing protein [uncultured Bacteroides sp.]